jgi:hypothetical protein
MKQPEEPVCGRAYIRHIHIKREDRERFADFLETISKERFINCFEAENNTHILYYVRLKKQELLYVKLAFKAIVKKQRKKKTAGPWCFLKLNT